ncbi:hypothetical protein [Providencia phage PSTCR5]|uniref:Uncharacterized protein n=1 Tax=Providencia phage PSTCR5 TaxID=2783547 RepID=A0A873WNJ8_9CAUD|nr:hypothetical protein KNV68_gp081 [Providencia phage PSTCR5]QPB12179.1 hypothetical protein [Providencia phage PSTCR5]
MSEDVILTVDTTDLADTCNRFRKFDGVVKEISHSTLILATKLDFDEVLDFLDNINIEVLDAR